MAWDLWSSSLLSNNTEETQSHSFVSSEEAGKNLEEFEKMCEEASNNQLERKAGVSYAKHKSSFNFAARDCDGNASIIYFQKPKLADYSFFGCSNF